MKNNSNDKNRKKLLKDTMKEAAKLIKDNSKGKNHKKLPKDTMKETAKLMKDNSKDKNRKEQFKDTIKEAAKDAIVIKQGSIGTIAIGTCLGMVMFWILCTFGPLLVFSATILNFLLDLHPSWYIITTTLFGIPIVFAIFYKQLKEKWESSPRLSFLFDEKGAGKLFGKRRNRIIAIVTLIIVFLICMNILCSIDITSAMIKGPKIF